MNDWLKDAETRRLRERIEWHLDHVADGRELRNRLEGMTANPQFGAFGWLWAPRLYNRNRALFRPFILQYFADHFVIREPQWSWVRVDYAGEVERSLDPWLAQLEKDGETALFYRIYAWKHRGENGWGVDSAAWCRDLSERFVAASQVQRPKLLELYNQPGTLDEDTALRLYDAEPALAAPFILRHLPARRWWGGNESHPARWTRLDRAARARGDETYAWKLYRQQVGVDEWAREALKRCRVTASPERLCAELEDRHPETGWSGLGPHFHRMIELRGLEVLPYVRKHLRRVLGFGRDKSYGDIESLARRRGWTDFWSAVVVTCANYDDYNKAFASVLEDASLQRQEKRRRLSMLSGVSQEWNGLGWGLARVQQLNDANAMALYRLDPDLLRQNFKSHVTPAWREDYLGLFEAAWSAGDEELADYLASRYATRWHGGGRNKPGAQETAAERYIALKLDNAAFARRAANVLSLIPAYSIFNYSRLIEANRLARLLFERSLKTFLSVPAAVRDLVEGGEIHVQMLAYRVLGLADERAKVLAAENLDILLGTVLRPLHRNTRLAAFAALSNAAYREDSARVVLARCREAFALPDERYPKEALVSLIAAVLARFPVLAGADEQRRIFRRAA